VKEIIEIIWQYSLVAEDIPENMSGVLKHGNKEKDGVKAMGFPLCYNKVP